MCPRPTLPSHDIADRLAPVNIGTKQTAQCWLYLGQYTLTALQNSPMLIRGLHLKMQFSNLHFGKPLENKEILHALLHHALW